MNDTFALTGLDISVMLIYAVGIIGYGIYSAKAKTSEEYFLAGRDMTTCLLCHILPSVLLTLEGLYNA